MGTTARIERSGSEVECAVPGPVEAGSKLAETTAGPSIPVGMANAVFAEGVAAPDLQRRESIGLGGEEAGVLGDAYHGEDLGEVRRESEGVDFLAGV